MKTKKFSDYLRHSQSMEIVSLFIFSIIFCSGVVYLSVNHGRLSIPLQYDDITYHYDAVKRLIIYRDSGLLAFLQSFASFKETGLGLHAPSSTVLSILGFVIFGIKDWAPYMLNSAYLFLTLAFVYHLTARLSVFHRISAYILTLGTPFVIYMLSESRPDMGAGLVNAIAAILIMQWGFDTDWRKKVTIGLLVSAAVLIKPTMAMFSLGIIGIAAIAKSIEILFIDRSMNFLDAIKWMWMPLVVVLIMVGPYAYFHGADRVSYVLHNLVADKEIWGLAAGLQKYKWRMYLDLVFGRTMFNNHIYIFAAILTIGTVLSLLYKLKTFRLFSILLCVFLAWIIPTYFSKSNAFFASTFYYLALFSCIYLANEIALHFRKRLSINLIIISVFMASPLLSKAVISRHFAVDQQYAQSEHRMVNDIVEILYTLSIQKNKKIKLFYSGLSSAISYDIINYKLLTRGANFETDYSSVFADDLEASFRGIRVSDAILAFDPGSHPRYVNTNFPSHKNIGPIRDYVKSNNYELLLQRPFHFDPSRHVYLFARTKRSAYIDYSLLLSN